MFLIILLLFYGEDTTLAKIGNVRANKK